MGRAEAQAQRGSFSPWKILNSRGMLGLMNGAKMRVSGRPRAFFMRALLFALAVPFALACEEEKPKALDPPEKDAQKEAPLPPAPKSPPGLSVDEAGPQVRGLGVVLTQENGAPDALGLEKLRTYLNDEKDFLTGKELTISVIRTAKPTHVALFLTELSQFSPTKMTVTTATRGDLPGQVQFVAQRDAKDADPCSLVGTITEDRGTAIWRLSGGVARKRGRGMGGPDLSMTGDTIVDMKKSCESDVFFVTGVAGIEWGLIYDLAAAGVSLEKAGLTKAVVPTSEVTAGNPVAF